MRTICARRMHAQELSLREDVEQGLEDHGTKKWRKALLSLNRARNRLGVVLEQKVRREQVDRQTREGFAKRYRFNTFAEKCRLTEHAHACVLSWPGGRNIHFSLSQLGCIGFGGDARP